MRSNSITTTAESKEQKHSVQKNLRVVTAEVSTFDKVVIDLVTDKNYRLAHFFATDDRKKTKSFGIHAILTPEAKDEWIQVSAALPEKDPTYPSLTKHLMAANWYERYSMDMFGIVADGHPDPRRLVHHENIPLNTHPLRKDFAWNKILEKDNVEYPMQHVSGNGIFEIPVGPIHAGIIEPGHFRFNVGGERVITLEGKLFFTHKGVEKIIEGKDAQSALPFVERVSGDTAAAHALAFCQAIELISGKTVSDHSQLIRTLIVELERLTMHIHDLANIAGMGTGYSVMAAHGFKIKEKLVRLSEKLFGNRFWRGVIVPGGVSKNLEKSELKLITDTVSEVVDEMRALLKTGLSSDGLLERLTNTGILKKDAAKAYGAVGVAARASGIPMDTRIDHPYAAYPQLKFSVVSKRTGDVYSRYMVRVGEIDTTFDLINQLFKLLQKKEVKLSSTISIGHGEAFSAVEGWRGEIISFVRTDEKGLIDRISIRDPSFCNWPLFGELVPGNIVPDFPLCNKSLNLSYSGADL